MNNFWNWVKGSEKREKLYITIDSQVEKNSHQDVKEQIEKLKEEKIQSFGLSSVNPDFLQSKEIELSLSRVLLAHKDHNTPFYFRVTRYQIIEPKNFRLRITFTSNQEIKFYEHTGASEKNVSSIWNHLIAGGKLSEYDFSEWFDNSSWLAGYLQQRKKQEEIELQHPPLLIDVFWDFSGSRFKNNETFIQVVNDYHKELDKKWKPNENLKAPLELIVFYPYWKDDREKTGKMTLKNPQSWTKADLLLAIHNKCVTKIQSQDNHFMEGLTYHNQDKSGIATYFLNLGS